MMTSTSTAAAAVSQRLAAADARLARTPWRSLAPGRSRARSLTETSRLVLGGRDDAVAVAFADTLAAVAVSMQESFPENLFGDLESLAASIWAGARTVDDPVAFIGRQGQRIVELQRLFGGGTVIRFRYVHDFVYGFDWAKWVAREPASRVDIGPFDPEFLAFMLHRGQELLVLIAEGRDQKYPPLPDGRPRNPFGFSREPAAEITLHEHLAVEGLLPLEAWRVDAVPRWNRPFASLRREAAQGLGLGH
ncbi:MAG: ferrochelatase [Myxococcota bacterium]